MVPSPLSLVLIVAILALEELLDELELGWVMKLGLDESAPSEEGAKGLVEARILVCTIVVTSSLRSLARILVFLKARSLRSLTFGDDILDNSVLMRERELGYCGGGGRR